MSLLSSTVIKHGINLGTYGATLPLLYQSAYTKITYTTITEKWLFYVVSINAKENTIHLSENQVEFALLYFNDLSNLPNVGLQITSFLDNKPNDIILVRELKMSIDYKPYMWKFRAYNIKDSKYLIRYFEFNYFVLDNVFYTFDSSIYTSTSLPVTVDSTALNQIFAIPDLTTKFLNCGINEYWYGVCTGKL